MDRTPTNEIRYAVERYLEDLDTDPAPPLIAALLFAVGLALGRAETSDPGDPSGSSAPTTEVAYGR